MGSKALFVSHRKLERAENIKAVWDAYDGEKEFAQEYGEEGRNKMLYAESLGYGVIVADDFFRPIRNKRNTKVIVIGHAIMGGKSYGLDQPNAYHNRKKARQIDYFVSSSERCRGMVSRLAGMPRSRVLSLGCPRTDAYFRMSKGDGKTGYADKRMYLFVPTFRKAGVEPELTLPDWRRIDSMLTDDEVLVVKRHMVTKNRLVKEDGLRHVVEVSNALTSTEFLVDCDVVMTDYSSIFLDGYVLRKPCVLYEADGSAYVGVRGMYRKYPEEYSSRCCTGDEDELVSMLREAAENGMGEVELECLDFTAGACDGNSAKRVAQLVRDCMEGKDGRRNAIG